MIHVEVWRAVALLGLAALISFVFGAWYVVGRIDHAERRAKAQEPAERPAVRVYHSDVQRHLADFGREFYGSDSDLDVPL